ncbi:hypothetical protein TIFTF001_030697 [Ficus carica]|uniref:Uncharacterized protein n=1 Tax=Ficus carica TaxID=3494 RepID=A0AA88J378_FICCA|nr:hypothetical protein TIFTF001_030697 [Ficus carica]
MAAEKQSNRDCEGGRMTFFGGGREKKKKKRKSVNVVMETKGGKKKSSSSSSNNSKSQQYEAPLGYSIEDIRPNGGIEKFRSAAYSNCVRKPS